MAAMEERERTAADISEAEKVEFLQRIYQGLNRQEAAHSMGFSSPRPWRALCSPQSPFYDGDFHNAYERANGSLEFEQNRLERLRAEGQRRALTDSDRLLEKFLMVYDPDWRVLREKDVNVSVDVIVQRVFKTLSTDKLEQILAWMDSEQIEEAEIEELPPGRDGGLPLHRDENGELLDADD
jgi:hypothetical protein